MNDAEKTKEELIEELQLLRNQILKLTTEQNYQREREQYAYLMINEMFQFIGLLDPAGRVLEVNQTALAAAGIKFDDVINVPFWQTPWWKHSEEFQEKLKDAIARAARGEFVRFEAEHFLGPERRLVVVDFSLKPIFNDEGKVIYLLPEGRDITEKREAEAEVARKNAALAAQREELLQSYKKANLIFSAFIENLPGMILDEKYHLQHKIGDGGYGAVYRAKHISLDRSVAVKIFHPVAGNDSFESLARFQQEGISAARVIHPNAIAILDSGVTKENIAYLVMELLEGRSLADLLDEEKILSLERAAEIIVPICDVLAEAHRNGIIHRDIKPANIFLHRMKEREVIKVVDFGIAKMLDERSHTAVTMTGTGGIIGTPIYMSPERLSRKAYDGKADVYSLAVMSYQMLTGNLPFNIDGWNIMETMIAHLKEEPIPLRRLNAIIPVEIEEILNQALAKDPADRPSAQEFAHAFIAASGLSYPSE